MQVHSYERFYPVNDWQINECGYTSIVIGVCLDCSLSRIKVAMHGLLFMCMLCVQYAEGCPLLDMSMRAHGDGSTSLLGAAMALSYEQHLPMLLS